MKQMIAFAVAALAACASPGYQANGLTDSERVSFRNGSIQRVQVSLAVFQNEDSATRKRYFCTSSWNVEFKPGWHIDPRLDWAIQLDPNLPDDAEYALSEYGKYVYCPKQVRNPEATRRGYDILKKVGTLTETFNWEYFQKFRTDQRVFRKGVYPAVYQLR
jgi:hypothetical protein